MTGYVCFAGASAMKLWLEKQQDVWDRKTTVVYGLKIIDNIKKSKVVLWVRTTTTIFFALRCARLSEVVPWHLINISCRTRCVYQKNLHVFVQWNLKRFRHKYILSVGMLVPIRKAARLIIFHRRFGCSSDTYIYYTPNNQCIPWRSIALHITKGR